MISILWNKQVGLAIAMLLAIVALALPGTRSALANPPIVDGFVQDPVTGVVEPGYVLQGITYTQDQVSGNFSRFLFTAENT